MVSARVGERVAPPHGLDTEGRLQNMIAHAVGTARETCA